MDQSTAGKILQQLRDLDSKFTNLSLRIDQPKSDLWNQQEQSFSSPENVLLKLNSKIEQLQRDVQDLKMAVHGHGAPVSHQLADNITGIIGLKEAVRAKHPSLKYAWSFLLCLGIAATIWFLYATTNDFFEEPTLTKIKLKTQPTYDYPPIVFCHDAWFDVDKATKTLNMSLDAFKYSLGYWRYLDQLQISNITRARQEFNDVFVKNKFPSLTDYYKAISIDFKPEYSDTDFFNSTVSSYRAFNGLPEPKKVTLPLKSVCHAFTLPPVEARLGMLYEPGFIGLKLKDQTKGLVPVSRNWMLHFAADQSALYTWPLVIRPSTYTLIRISVQKFKIYQTSDNTCRSIMNDNYTAGACMTDCQNRIFKENINCRMYWLTGDDFLPNEYCNEFDFTDRNSSIFSTVEYERKKMEQKLKDVCWSSCPRRCERFLYDVTVQGDDVIMSDFETVKAIDQARHTDTPITAVGFVHDAMRQGGLVTIEEVSSYSFTELVNNVGGTLGLFIGGTVMTLAQVVLFLMGFICCDRKQRVNVIDVKSV